MIHFSSLTHFLLLMFRYFVVLELDAAESKWAYVVLPSRGEIVFFCFSFLQSAINVYLFFNRLHPFSHHLLSTICISYDMYR
ncbi:hypothetical protein Lalb_Chr05g0211361 [Lupinus albus]|uniref:Uncharacterized protein n=1 Tax=Lupinus albus TaxID=3870 RepID=A0A6A4QG37_LUPAL|nr:hypothetical protein Lalb_Chr05g0211361 [Lupinus albus]